MTYRYGVHPEVQNRLDALNARVEKLEHTSHPDHHHLVLWVVVLGALAFGACGPTTTGRLDEPKVGQTQ